MNECPVCLDNIEENKMIYFSCNKHGTCEDCYYKCHVPDQPYLLRCPICRAQHYKEDIIINNILHETHYPPYLQYPDITEYRQQLRNYLHINNQLFITSDLSRQFRPYLWTDICNTLIIHITSITIIIVTLKIFEIVDLFNF